MPTKSKAWQTGTGNITLTYTGQGDGTIQVDSDPNNLYEARSAQITVKTTDGSNITRTITIQQAAKVRIDISTATVTAANQTYSGSAKTPAPTVTLDGSTIPSTGYDVTYSDNVNAGTATITVTGKGDYTGTATGTFTINKATGSVTTVPTGRDVTYTGSSQYLVTSGSGTGTMYYRYKLSTSSSWSSWSTTRPSRTTAGTYNIEYYAAESDNYTQSATGSLDVTMKKASRTLSFSISTVTLNTSTTATYSATPSAGSSDGTITYSIGSTTYATINSSTGAVTTKTSDGSTTVSATISEGTNYLSASASYTLNVFATVHNFSYTGSVQSLSLPVGSYKLQCWGAQGGSNSSNSTYSITAKAGGLGGYAEGVLTISSNKTVYVFVGGQGSSSGNGGWNCGGGNGGSVSKDVSGGHYHCSFGNGGGATDIALTTSSMSYSSYRNNRSSASLLSRMIVAGGGGGGAMGTYTRVVDTDTSWGTRTMVFSYISGGTIYTYVPQGSSYNADSGLVFGKRYKITCSNSSANVVLTQRNASNTYYGEQRVTLGTTFTLTKVNSNVTKASIVLEQSDNSVSSFTLQIYEVTSSRQLIDSSSRVGYQGGGLVGAGYGTNYTGRETSAGLNADFGKGANRTSSSYGFHGGLGGAGWYGGGCTAGDSLYYTTVSGAGSGFVNTSASASYRPSGYTGLQLDSGETIAGTQSFPSTSGSTETGHAGNGYAKITRLS